MRHNARSVRSTARRNQQYVKAGLRLSRILDSHFIAITREQDHLAIDSPLSFLAAEFASFNDIGEGFVVADPIWPHFDLA
jgi:hypothetical protein